MYEDTWHRDGAIFHEEGNATELIAGQVVKWIGEKRAPWFIYVPFHAVHIPVDAPDKYKQLYAGVKFHDDPAKHDSRLRLGAFVSQMDAEIGGFIAALEKTGQRQNTLVVFTSDNGGQEKGGNSYVGKTPGLPLGSNNTPLCGMKNQLYEGGIRVCAFANWPGTLAPRKVTAPMHAVDWFPTISAVAGYQPARELKWDGMDMWPALTGAVAKPEPRTILWRATTGNAIRSGDWKLFITKSGQGELFNLADDPYERNDRAAAESQRVEALRAQMQELRKDDVTKLPPDLEGLPH